MMLLKSVIPRTFKISLLHGKYILSLLFCNLGPPLHRSLKHKAFFGNNTITSKYALTLIRSSYQPRLN